MFYILFKDQWVEHSFDYLSLTAQKARLEPTLPNTSNRDLKKFRNNRPENAGERPKIPVGQIMSKQIIQVTGNQTITDCIKKMEKENIHHLVVQENEKFLGLISQRDLLPFKKIKNAGGAKIELILNTVILGVHESTTLGEVCLVLYREKISSLPVLDDDLQVCGIVTINDVLRKSSEFFI